jgi:hypothetical protein
MSRRFSLTPKQRAQIAERFYKKVRTKYKTDAEFYTTYDVPAGTFEHWKKDGKINLALIIQFCEDENVDLNYIFRNILPEDIPRRKKAI